MEGMSDSSLSAQLLGCLPDQWIDPLEVATPAVRAVQAEDVGAGLTGAHSAIRSTVNSGTLIYKLYIQYIYTDQNERVFFDQLHGGMVKPRQAY